MRNHVRSETDVTTSRSRESRQFTDPSDSSDRSSERLHQTPTDGHAQRRKPRSQRASLSPGETSRSLSAAPGARVARVAVDDETWAAFRELCGSTPASVRLGDLVRAEVARAASRRDQTTEALLALRVIADQADALEAYIRARTH